MELVWRENLEFTSCEAEMPIRCSSGDAGRQLDVWVSSSGENQELGIKLGSCQCIGGI